MDPRTSNEDSKRLLLALGISAAIFILWSLLFPPKPPQTPLPSAPEVVEAPEKPAATPDSGPAVADPGDADSESPTVPEPTREVVQASGREEITVDTGTARIVLLNRGAAPVSWTLHGYEGYENGDDVELVDRRAFQFGFFPFQLDLGQRHAEQTQRLNEAFWRVESDERVGEEHRVAFRYSDGLGLEAEKRFVFLSDGYIVRIAASVHVDGQRIPAALVWGPGIANHPEGLKKNRYFQRPRVVSGSGGRYSQWTDPEDSPDLRGRQIRWAGVDDQYFAALALLPGARTGVHYTNAAAGKLDEEGEEEYPAPVLLVPLEPGGEATAFFVGPKKLKILESLPGGDFAQIIEMGRYVGYIARWLLKGLIWIHGALVTNYGWAIILMTIAIRLLFFPLTQRSMKKMREMSEKMKRVQPQQKAIRAKYKGERDVRKRQRMNEEIMALYKREGINPADQLSGCLPMLLQMPIFFAFFRMLPASIELRKEPWILWIHDLSQPDPFYITPLLMGVVFFFSTRRSMSQQATQMEGFQRQIMMMMPLMFTVFCLWAPAGLVVYWLFSNLIQLGQQELLRRQMPGGNADQESNKGKGSGGKKRKKGGK